MLVFLLRISRRRGINQERGGNLQDIPRRKYVHSLFKSHYKGNLDSVSNESSTKSHHLSLAFFILVYKKHGFVIFFAFFAGYHGIVRLLDGIFIKKQGKKYQMRV